MANKYEKENDNLRTDIKCIKKENKKLKSAIDKKQKQYKGNHKKSNNEEVESMRKTLELFLAEEIKKMHFPLSNSFDLVEVINAFFADLSLHNDSILDIEIEPKDDELATKWVLRVGELFSKMSLSRKVK